MDRWQFILEEELKEKSPKDIYTAHCQKGAGKGKDTGMPAGEASLKRKSKKEKADNKKKEEHAAAAKEEQARQRSTFPRFHAVGFFSPC